MELTEHEKNTVLRMRKAQAERKQRKEAALHILKTAYLFERWMQENGVGPSYSTFCDDFGYEAGEDEHRPTTYKRVMLSIELVYT